ncbi:MAG: fibronectin type III domain-containing protein [Treponema sp.]|nr:fibronectin type III domain-containing protein [Treponema sp.]
MKNYERYFFAALGLALTLVLSACSLPFDKFETVAGKQKPDVSAIPVPKNVSAQTKTASRIDLAWQADPAAASYSVYRSTAENGDYIAITTVQKTSYTDNSVSANTVYFYYITLSVNNRGEGGKSATVQADTKPPAPPESVNTAVLSATKITITWQPVAAAESYKVYRSSAQNSGYTAITTGSVTATSYSDETVSFNNDYYYRVTSVNSIGEGEKSVYAIGSVKGPAAPGVPTVTKGDSLLTVSWLAVDGASAYEVWAGTSNNPEAATKRGDDVTGLSAIISGLTNNTVYSVWIKAKNSVGASGFSLGASGTPFDSTASPSKPGTPLVRTAGAQLTVSWQAVEGASAYEVWMSQTAHSASASQNGDDVTGSLTKTISGLTNGATYYVWIKAKNDVGSSDFSDPASGTPIADMGAITLTAGNGQLTASWAAVAGADQYEVYYSTGSNPPESAQQAVSTTTATIAGLANGVTYTVWVRGWNASGTGSMSAGTSGTPIADMGDVTLVAGNEQLTVSWSAVAGADQYEVYYSTDTTIPNTAAQTVSGATATITGLSNGTVYNVWVKGKNETGVSSASAMKSGKPLGTPGAPSISADENALTVSWTAAAGAEQYEVYYGTTSTPTTLFTTTSATSVTITGLTNGTLYYVRLKAKNSTSTSAYGVTASGTPSPPIGLYDGATKIGDQNLAAAVAWLSTNAVSGHNYTIVLGADESASNINLSYPGKTVGITLRGSGIERTISLGANGALFTVETGVTLTLDDNVTLVGRSSNTSSLVSVFTSGMLVMNDGSKITGNAVTSSYGGGVYVASSGTFTMEGGTISGNTASSSSVSAYSSSSSYGGGVYISGGTFTMSGGTISGNTASSSGSVYSSSSSSGGGVYVSSGTFTMEGGAISGNTASSRGDYGCSSSGGGVYVSEGTFTMEGGSISGNTASSFSSPNGSAGGGVFVRGIFTMEGGSISGNTASSPSSVYGGGGGVYIDGTFQKTGGIIYGDTDTTHTAGSTENTASSGHGHAVYVAGRKRNSTAGEEVNLDSSTAENWE